MAYYAFISTSDSMPTRRKVHIANEDWESLCGIEKRCDWLLYSVTAEYTDIDNEFFLDPDGEGCKRCGSAYRKQTKLTAQG